MSSDTKEERAKQRRLKKDQKVFGNPVSNQQNGMSFVSQSQIIKDPQATAKPEKKVGFFDKLVISPDMIGKRVFSFIITILALRIGTLKIVPFRVVQGAGPFGRHDGTAAPPRRAPRIGIYQLRYQVYMNIIVSTRIESRGRSFLCCQLPAKTHI